MANKTRREPIVIQRHSMDAGSMPAVSLIGGKKDITAILMQLKAPVMTHPAQKIHYGSYKCCNLAGMRSALATVFKAE